MTSFLTQDQIMKLAPSVFTEGRHERTSKDYAPISTFRVLEGLFDLGFGVTKATEVKVRRAEKKGFAKHMLRLRRHNETNIDGQFPEIVLINSHDGSTSYQLNTGIYRLVCSNGLVAWNDLFTHKVRHEGDVATRIAEAGSKIIEVFPTVMDKAIEWGKIELAPSMKNALAESAKVLRWEENEELEVPTMELLTPRRSVDRKNDLWTTYNVIQENLIKGGVYVRNPTTGERRKSKAVTTPSENTKLNQALWQLTERMATLVF